MQLAQPDVTNRVGGDLYEHDLAGFVTTMSAGSIRRPFGSRVVPNCALMGIASAAGIAGHPRWRERQIKRAGLAPHAESDVVGIQDPREWASANSDSPVGGW